MAEKRTMVTAEQKGQARRRRRVRSARGRGHMQPKRLAILLAAVVAAFLLGTFLLTTAPDAYASWREGRLLKRANAELQRENFGGAKSIAEEALQVRPHSLPAFQILAEATERQNLPETVTWRSQIARLNPGDPDSQLNLASAALRFGRLDLARRALENIAPTERDRAPYHVVAGWLARAEGNDREVERHFAAAVKEEPSNDLYQFNLGVLRIHSADDDENGAARETLERLSKIPGFRAGSLRALLSDAIERDDLEAADRLAQDLQMTQHVTFSDYLLCLDFYRKLDARKFSALLEKVKPVAARDAGDLALLLEWMNNHGLAAEALRWMEKLPPAEVAAPHPAAAIAEAFAQLKNWSRLRRWTRTGSWGDADYLRLAYQAYAVRQAKQTAAETEFDALWHSAEHAAGDAIDRETMLARLATKWNLTGEAEPLWQRVAKEPRVRLEALNELYSIQRARNDLPNLLKLAQQRHENSPNDPDAAADFARLALLLEQNAEEGHRLARAAYEAVPADANCAVTYAFSLYGQARTAEGIEVLRKLPAEALHDPHAAVFTALLLADSNEIEAAKEYLTAAQSGPIWPEEKKLFDEANQKVVRAAEIAAATTPPPIDSDLAPPPSLTPAPSPSP